MRVFCKRCGIVISKDLKPLVDTSLINETDGEDFLPPGYYVDHDGSYFTRFLGGIVINLCDLINCIEHPDRSRLNGCCDLDGLDGPNKICINGHEVGTEISDCWTVTAFLFEMEGVRIQD